MSGRVRPRGSYPPGHGGYGVHTRKAPYGGDSAKPPGNYGGPRGGSGGGAPHGSGSPRASTIGLPTVSTSFPLKLNTDSYYVVGLGFPEDCPVPHRDLLAQWVTQIQGKGMYFFEHQVLFMMSPVDEGSYQVQMGEGAPTLELRVVSCKRLSTPEETMQMLNIAKRDIITDALGRRFVNGVYVMNERSVLGADSLISAYPAVSLTITRQFLEANQPPIWVLNIDPRFHIENSASLLQLAMNDQLQSLVGETIVTRYNNKTYVLEGVQVNMTARNTFDCKGRQISFLDYFGLRGVTLQYPDAKLIRASSPRSTCYLPPEMCFLKRLPPQACQQLPRLCSIAPQDRYNQSMAVLRDLQQLRELPPLFEIGSNPCEYKLERAPPIYMKISHSGPGRLLSRFQNENYMADRQPRQICLLVMYYRDPREDIRGQVEDFTRSVLSSCGGPRVLPLECMEISYCPFNTRDIRDAVSRAKITSNTFVLCYLPKNDRLAYPALLQLSIDNGFSKQCVTFDSFERRRKMGQGGRAIQTNIMLQIAHKCNLITRRLLLRQTIPGFKQKYIVSLGIDAYHPFSAASGRGLGPEDMGSRPDLGPSRVAFAACVYDENRLLFSCHAQMNADSGKEPGSRSVEYSSGAYRQVGAARVLSFCLSKLRELTNCRNEEVLVAVWRDGVSSTQMTELYQSEIMNIRPILGGANFVFTVVQKRLHQRFLARTSAGHFTNIDQGVFITNGLDQDLPGFYYNPVSPTNNSTCKPVKFLILANEPAGAWNLEQHKALVAGLTYNYMNWAGPIKVPSELMNAHQIAYKMGECKVAMSTEEFHPRLISSFWFL